MAQRQRQVFEDVFGFGPRGVSPELRFGLLPPRLRKPKRRRIDKRKKKKKKKREVLPTLTQQLMGYRGTRAISRPTGFEAIRII